MATLPLEVWARRGVATQPLFVCIDHTTRFDVVLAPKFGRPDTPEPMLFAEVWRRARYIILVPKKIDSRRIRLWVWGYIIKCFA